MFNSKPTSAQFRKCSQAVDRVIQVEVQRLFSCAAATREGQAGQRRAAQHDIATT
ncbi:MAG: hypothetical protein P8X53_10370 [Chromatiales bacterium]